MKLNRSSKIVFAALLVAQNFTAVAQLPNAVVPQDYPKFLARYNIFNPNRLPNVIYVPPPKKPTYTPVPPPKQIEAFSLTGIVGYGDGKNAGVYAFFDGTYSNYHKTARLNDGIANFRVIDIAADSVTLMADTNSRVVLKIGEQLHNDGVGHWLTADGVAANYSSASGYNTGGNGRNGFGNFGNGNGGNGFNNVNGGRRRNGNNNNANFGNTGNFNRGRNNLQGPGAPADNSQPNDPTMNLQDNSTTPFIIVPMDNGAMPASPDDTAPPDSRTQDNSVSPQTGQAVAFSTDLTDANTRLQAARTVELQQTGN